MYFYFFPFPCVSPSKSWNNHSPIDFYALTTDFVLFFFTLSSIQFLSLVSLLFVFHCAYLKNICSGHESRWRAGEQEDEKKIPWIGWKWNKIAIVGKKREEKKGKRNKKNYLNCNTIERTKNSTAHKHRDWAESFFHHKSQSNPLSHSEGVWKKTERERERVEKGLLCH